MIEADGSVLLYLESGSFEECQRDFMARHERWASDRTRKRDSRAIKRIVSGLVRAEADERKKKALWNGWKRASRDLTSREVDLIRKNFGIVSSRDLRRMLRGVTWYQITYRARVLGVSRRALDGTVAIRRAAEIIGIDEKTLLSWCRKAMICFKYETTHKINTKRLRRYASPEVYARVYAEKMGEDPDEAGGIYDQIVSRLEKVAERPSSQRRPMTS